jgi:hypothetical protein
MTGSWPVRTSIADVRFWHKADILFALRNSAFGVKADIAIKSIRLSVIATVRIRLHEMDS